MPVTVRVEGLRELNRRFARLDAAEKRELRADLRAAAEPVRSEAEHRAVADIRNIGSVWSRMKLGMTASYVYVAPKTRRRLGSPRPNVGTLLFKAMAAALEAKEREITRVIEELLDRRIRQEGL